MLFNLPDGIFALCNEIAKGKPVDELDEGQKYLFSVAIEKGLYVKDGDRYKLNYYFATQQDFCELHELAKDFYGTAEKYFSKGWKKILAAYKHSVPKHLHWQMGNFLSNSLNAFVTCSIYDAERQGLLSQPKDADKAWLSLFSCER